MMCDDDSQDVFESALWHFFSTLKKMACLDNDPVKFDFETPWEIRQDFFVGLKIFESSPRYTELSDQQLKALKRVEKSLRDISDDALAARHSNWNAIREQAKELITYLEPAILRNQSFFNEPDQRH